MTPREMEVALVRLSERWVKDRDEAARAEYRRLHPLWVEAKRQETP